MKASTLFKLIFILLTILGLLMIYSSSKVIADYKYNDSFYYLKRELIYLGIAIVLFILFYKFINYKKLIKYSFYLLIIGFILLILVLIKGIGVIKNGSRSWIGLGFLSFQPSEFMKLALILFSTKLVSLKEGLFTKKKYVLFYLFILGLVFLLIMLEPDFGSAIIILLSLSTYLYRHLISYKWIGFISIFGILFFIILIILAPYRLTRIFAFIDPFKDPLGSGFQAIQSLYALAPSGFFGFGLFNSMQKYLYLPEAQTDFIFAILVEELGFFGGVLTILLFFGLIFIGYFYSLKIENKEASNLLFGFSSLFLVQIFINIGVVITLLPVTGVTLPLISYGGTSLMVSYIILAIMCQIMDSENLT